MPNKLLILGNGFDKWLCLPTSYVDFKNFLYSKENIKKYVNCKLLLELITKGNKIDEWNELENSMIDWLNNSNNLDTLSSEIDYIEACKEKNIALKNWVYNIREKYKEKLKQLYDLFNEMSSEVSIWTFNYIIDFNNRPKSDLITNTTIGNPDKRAVTQLHYFSQNEQNIKWDGTKQTAYIEFGGDYENFNQKYRMDWNINQHCVIKFCTKFNPVNIIFYHKVKKILQHPEAFYDNITDPYKWAYYDGIGLQAMSFMNREIKEVNFIGFSFGKQDIRYFRNNDNRNLIKYCKINYTYYKDFELNTIRDKILCLNRNIPAANKYVNRTITPYRTNELLKNIFGDKFQKLLKIKELDK